MELYIVTKGIFEGHIFKGKLIVIDGEKRLFDENSVGRSYPLKNCKPYNN